MDEFLSTQLYTIDHPVEVKSLILAVNSIIACLFLRKFIQTSLDNMAAPEGEMKAERHLKRFCFKAIGWLILLAGFLYAVDCLGIEISSLLGFLNFPLFNIGESTVNPLSILVSILILVLTFGAFRYVPVVLRKRLFNYFRLTAGVEYTFQRIGQYLVIVIGVLFALSYVGVKLQGLAFVAGLMSVGLGFGLQNIVSNFVSGIILLFERPVQVGDRIKIGDAEGDIRSIKIRCTVVITPDNVSYLVPNSDLLSSTVINLSTNDPKIRLHIPVGVAYGSDVQLVKSCLLKAAAENADILDEPVPIVRFLNFGDSSLDFDLLAWIGDPVKQYDISSDLNFSIERILRENDITIPFPQRDVHIISSEPESS
ncbi:MAG: mechanosensitive ion channel [Planctomycetota bacterium]|jgi:small-conductance mechanosensitive channel|nr:mechanosensitive ion channel [Planctomycetota bacterium]